MNIKEELEALAKIFDKDFAGNAAVIRRGIARIEELEKEENVKACERATATADLHEW